jgi:membrane protease YdiL (CAAX protease family)
MSVDEISLLSYGRNWTGRLVSGTEDSRQIMNVALEGAGRAEPRQERAPLGPIGALVFFALAFGSTYLVAWLAQQGDLGEVGRIVARTPVYTAFLVLPLAYAFYPHVFTKRFWHFPRNTWKWLFGITALEAVGLLLGGPQAPVPKAVAVGVILISPPIEEIARAVLISPLLDRWGRFWAILITTGLTMLAHPDPLRVVVPMFVLTAMLVYTDRSIPATALGHALMNAIVVAAAEIGSA